MFFAAYLFDRGRNPELFAEGQRTLVQGYGIANTLLLLTSSLFVVVGVRAARMGRFAIAQWTFGVAIVCGLGFATLKFVEYGDKISQGITGETSSFYAHYFTLTGLHFFHVAVGLVVLLLIIRTLKKPQVSANQLRFVEGGACFWHMVDYLWMAIFPLLYLIH